MIRRVAGASAILLGLFDLALRVGGARAHASVIAGLPLSEASYVLGPLGVSAHLAAVTVGPILILGLAIDAAWTRRSRDASDVPIARR